MNNTVKHIPVLLNEVLEALAPQAGKTYVDATFGNGGYSEAVLKAADCRLIAVDRDPNVRPRAEELKSVYGSRFDFRPGRFGDIERLIQEPVDGIVFDIGVSSMQIDQAERGFSYNKDAALDMRMSCTGISAADIVNASRAGSPQKSSKPVKPRRLPLPGSWQRSFIRSFSKNRGSPIRQPALFRP